MKAVRKHALSEEFDYLITLSASDIYTYKVFKCDFRILLHE